MAIRNPLVLPEIGEALVPFLTTDDLTRCVRVCKGWHASLIPFLWKVVDVANDIAKQPQVAALRRNIDYVRHLTYQGGVPKEHAILKFPALRKLHLSISWEHDFGIIVEHPSLTHVTIHGAHAWVSWRPPDNLSNLTSLSLILLVVDTHYKDTVWNMFSRLESLELREVRMSGFPASATGSWKLKYMTLVSISGLEAKEQLRWLKYSPHLRRLTWEPMYKQTEDIVEEFTQSIVANAWPGLEELNIPRFRRSDRQMSLIIGGMQRVRGLSIIYNQPFDSVKVALRPHFLWLWKLDAASISGNDSLFTIEILMSCPQLEILRMGIVHVRDMLADDAPWACESSLRHLDVCFKVEADASEAEKRVLLERLSRLHNLKQLDLSTRAFLVQSLDLRLESGLEQLATLTQLEELNFSDDFEVV
ncbi:MAG: hypothetical protein J3Q66DRAFT_391399 [Benniella sp.]|nr:MAG: hypothetical protein J3Q66DRAFT_391399 [Benniella sp.]